MIRCTPTNIISPSAEGEKAGLTASNFLNQAHNLEMFGSHFKIGGAGLEDSATPTVNVTEPDEN